MPQELDLSCYLKRLPSSSAARTSFIHAIFDSPLFLAGGILTEKEVSSSKNGFVDCHLDKKIKYIGAAGNFSFTSGGTPYIFVAVS